MMYILNGVTKTDPDNNWKIWHVGTPKPRERSTVMTFQADGDELEIILRAIHEASRKY